jgi:hypothetical protein
MALVVVTRVVGLSDSIMHFAKAVLNREREIFQYNSVI